MSRTIDEKVVEMRFDNSKFESNVKESMSTLEKLKQSLKFEDSAKAFSNIDKAASKISFNGLNSGIDSVKAKFSALDVISATVLNRITNSVIDFGKKIVTAIPSQIKSGGIARAMNIESAKFQLEGLGVAWKSIEEDINYGVQDTAYGLDVAAKAAAQLTASGVKLGDNMKTALRGISGVAAMTNSSFEEISPIFTTIAGQGKVMTMQLRQLESRGLNAAATLAKNLKVSEAEVREMVQKGKIDFATFSSAMDEAFGEHAKDANKTFSGALSNMKAALSRIGADFATPAMRNLRDIFNEMRNVFNKVREFMQPVVKMFTVISNILTNSIVKRISEFTKYFDKIAVKKNVIEGISALMLAIWERLEAIGKAFSEVFKAAGLSDIKNMTEGFAEFANSLRPSKLELEALHYIFKGLFTVIKYVGRAMKIVLAIMAKLGPVITPIVTLGVTLALVGTVITKLTSKFMMFRNAIIATLPLLKVLGVVALAVGAILGGTLLVRTLIANADKVKAIFSNLTTAFKNWFSSLEAAHPALASFFGVLKNLGAAAVTIVMKVVEAFKNLPKLFGNFSWSGIFDNIAGKFKEFIKNAKQVNIIERLKNAFTNLGTSIKNFWNKVKDIFSKNGFLGGVKELGNKLSDFIKGLRKAKTESVEVMDELRMGAGPGNTFHEVIIGDEAEAENNLSLIDKFLKKLEEFKQKVTLGKIAAAAFSVVFVALIASIARAVSKVGTGIEKLTTSAAGVLDAIKSRIAGFNKKKLSTLEDLAIVIGTLTASLIALTFVDQGKLKSVTITLAILIGLVGGIALAMEKIPSKSAITGSNNTLLAFAISIGVIIGSLLFLNLLNLDGILIKLGVVAGLMIALALCAKIMGTINKGSIKSAVNLIAFAIALSSVCKALNEVNKLTGSWKRILAKVIGLVAIMGAMALLAAGIGQVKLTSAIGLLIVVAILKKIMPEIKSMISKVTLTDVYIILETLKRYEEVIIVLAGVVAGITIALGTAGKGIGKIGLGFLLLAAGFVVIGVAFKYISDTVAKMDESVLEKAGIILGGIGAFVAILATVLAAGAKNQIGKHASKFGLMILEVSVAMIIFTGVLAILNQLVKDDSIWAAAAIMAGLMVLITVMIGVAGSAKDVKTGPILSLLLGLAIIFAELIVLSLIDFTSLIMPLISMVAILTMVNIIFNTVGKIKPNKNRLGTLITVAAMLGGLGVILFALSKQDWTKLLVSAISMVAVIFAVDMLLDTISSGSGLGNAKTAKGKLKNLIAVTIMLGTLGASLYFVSRNNWKQIATAAGAMIGVILVMSRLLNVINKGSGLGNANTATGKMKVLLAVAATMASIGIALSLASKHNWKQIATAGASMVGVMLVMTLLIKTISGSKPDSKVTGLMLVLALDLVALGTALTLVAQNDWESIRAATIAIAIVMAELVIIAKIIEGVEVKFSAMAALIVMAVDLNIIASALNKLKDYDMESLKASVLAFIIVLGAMTAALGILAGLTKTGVSSIDYILVAASLVIVAAAVSILANAIDKVDGPHVLEAAAALSILFAVVAAGVTIVAEVVSKSLEVILGLAIVAGVFILLGIAAERAGEGVRKIGEGLLNMAIAINTINPQMDMQEMASGISSLAAACMVVGMIPAASFAMNSDSMLSLALGINSLSGADLSNVAPYMVQLAEGLFILGMSGTGLLMASAAMQPLAEGINALSVAIANLKIVLTQDATTLLSTVKTTYGNVGQEISDSLAKGINRTADLPAQAADDMASTIEPTVRDIVDVHSPSPTFIGIGKEVPGSLAYGISNNSGAVESAITNDLGGAVNTGFSGIWDTVKLWASKIKNAISRIFGAFKQGGFSGGFKQIGVEFNNLGKSVKDYCYEAGQTILATTKLNDIYEQFNQIIKESIPDLDDYASGMEDIASGIGSAGGAAASASSDFENLKSTIEGQMDIFSKFNDETSISADEMLDNMRSQIMGVSQWAANLQTLALRGINQGLLKKLGDMGPQGYAKVAAFVQMTDEQLQEANQLFATSLVLPGFAAQQVSGSYQYAGQMSAQGFLDGVDTGQFYDAGTKAANAHLNGLTTGLDEHSPSKKTRVIGVNAMAGLQLGMEDKAQSVYNSILNICSIMISKFKEKLTTLEFKNIGINITNGLADGINQAVNESGTTGIMAVDAFTLAFTYDAGYNSVYDFIEGFKRSIVDSFGFKDNSSAYTMELVEFFIQGIKDGVKENSKGFMTWLSGEDNGILQNIKDAIDKVLGFDAAKTMGEQLCSGFSIGITDNIDKVVSAAEDLASRVKEAIGGIKGLNFGSPSKLTIQYGKWLDEGLAIGIRKETGVVVNNADDMVSDVKDRMSMVINTITDMFNSNIDPNPTIAPVLDTSNIQNGLNNINTMFSNANNKASIVGTGYANMIKANSVQAQLDRSTENRLQRDYAQAIIDAVNATGNTDTNVTVVLDGDAGKVFNLVRTENNKFTKATGYNAMSRSQQQAF